MSDKASAALRLNERAARLVDNLVAEAERLRIECGRRAAGGMTIDLGIDVPGGLEAGRRLAEITMAGLGHVCLTTPAQEIGSAAAVQVFTDWPVAACMAAQYAGWKIAHESFFAMGSGPMRAAAGTEELFQAIGHRESASQAVGVLEARQFPPAELCAELAHQCRVPEDKLTLLIAPTASQAGGLQVVARSVETALHKLHELGFPLDQIESALGRAPLPPVAKNDLAAIGRTNDAILYGGEVTLWVRGGNDLLAQYGPRTPSNSSPDHGQPFGEIFRRYDHDFYRVDPALFSPAVVAFQNLDTGRTFRFGELRPDLLRRSFGGT